MPTPPASPGINLHQLLERDERLFSSHPQVSLYFPSAAMENARTRIGRTIDRGDGPALVVGGAGTGKSLLLQALAAEYRETFDVVLLACARVCTRRALLQSILFELGLPFQERDEGRLRLGLLDHLLSPENSPAGLLLLVDEAQSLSMTLLDELRVTTNLMRAGSPRVRLVLAGSTALEETFAHPDLESFSQRLAVRCYLVPLSRDETVQFVCAKLATVGIRPEAIFAADAFDAVFEASDGVPRLVNQLCDRALALADAANRPLVDRQVIQAAWADLQQLPVPWNTTPAAAASNAPAGQVIEFGSLDDTPSAYDEPGQIEPTELDPDDKDANAVGEFAPRVAAWTAGVEARPSGDGCSPAPRAPRDPANPFAEPFDEEEVVLDCFAAWDAMFHRGTPRVESRRDRGLATLVEAAIEAYPLAEHRPIDPVAEPASDESSEPEIAVFDAIDRLSPGDEPPVGRPRLRLVDVSDATTSNAPRSRPEADPTIASGRMWNRSIDTPERPILIVDDEILPAEKSGPPVRRLAYQHLFSRLRSG